MKKVTAIIRHYKLEEVKNALASNGFRGLTATEVKGFGRQRGHVETYRGTEYRVDFVPKTLVEIAVTDEDVDECVKTVIESARTGDAGDGKIFVCELEEVIRIRTGETGNEAI